MKRNEKKQIHNIQFDLTLFSELINKYQITKSRDLFLYPEINEKKGLSFIKEFQNLLFPTINEYRFLLLYDDTIFGKCDEGVAILLGDECKLFILISDDSKPLHISTINFDHHIFPRIKDLKVKDKYINGVELILNNSKTFSYDTTIGIQYDFERFVKHLIQIFNTHVK